MIVKKIFGAKGPRPPGPSGSAGVSVRLSIYSFDRGTALHPHGRTGHDTVIEIILCPFSYKIQVSRCVITSAEKFAQSENFMRKGSVVRNICADYLMSRLQNERPTFWKESLKISEN